MERLKESGPPVRVLALGNELLADDALGAWAAREVERRYGDAAEVVFSSAAGVRLIDYFEGASQIIVIDSIVTGQAAPGTVHLFGENDLAGVPGPAGHSLGIFDVLRMMRKAELPAPEVLGVIAVEAVDCVTFGAPIHWSVQSALPEVVRLVGELLGEARGVLTARGAPRHA